MLGEGDAPELLGSESFDVRAARFSSDGSRIAGFVWQDGAAIRLIVIDTAAGEVISQVRVPEAASAAAYLSWRSNTEIYLTADSWSQTETLIGRYDLNRGSLTTATLPFGGALTSIAIDAADVDAQNLERRPMAECTASQHCTFDF